VSRKRSGVKTCLLWKAKRKPHKFGNRGNRGGQAQRGALLFTASWRGTVLSGLQPGYANPLDIVISPDHAAGPKRVAVVKGQVELIRQRCDGSGVKT